MSLEQDTCVFNADKLPIHMNQVSSIVMLQHTTVSVMYLRSILKIPMDGLRAL